MSDGSRKYFFDLNNFDAHAIDETPPATVFTEDEINTTRKDAFALGEKKGLADAQNLRDQHVVTLTQKISQGIDVLIAAEHAREAKFEQELIALTRGFLSHIFPILNDAYGMPQITHTISEVLNNLRAAPAVIINVSPHDFDELSSRLNAMMSQYDGQIQITQQPDISPGSFDMKWEQGGAVRDFDLITKTLVEKLAQTLAETSEKTHT